MKKEERFIKVCAITLFAFIVLAYLLIGFVGIFYLPVVKTFILEGSFEARFITILCVGFYAYLAKPVIQNLIYAIRLK